MYNFIFQNTTKVYRTRHTGRYIKKISIPFFTTKEEGSGLGIPVCYSIAERHHARIDIETGSSGTTFYVRLPVAGR